MDLTSRLCENWAERNPSMHLAVGLALGFFLLHVTALAGPLVPRAPTKNPPTAFREAGKAVVVPPERKTQAPAVEWTFHKTADGLHPDGNEQAMLWLLNRARSDPRAEGLWLSDTGDTDVEAAINYFHVDLAIMRQAFDSYPARPPAAFDSRLWSASNEHALDLIARNAQDHTGQLDRVNASGFDYTAWAGIVFSYSKNALYAHAGFNIDWGFSDTGMQEPPGHRLALMDQAGFNPGLTNAGLAMVPETNPGTQVGPLVMAGSFCQADPNGQDVFNQFLVGTVWEDENQNAMYDPGEGISGVRVAPDRGTYFAVTGVAGGFAVPIQAAGDYVVDFSGGPLPRTIRRPAAVGTVSVLMDFRLDLAAGDVNLDGAVDLADLVLALGVLAGGNPAGVEQSVGPETPAYVLQALAGLR